MEATEIADSVLDVDEAVLIDNSIECWQFCDYTPQSQNNLDVRGSPIKIVINASDNYLIPSKSYLLIKGQLVRNDNGAAYDANAEIALVNNAMMYLFSEIRYSINGNDMEKISYPGQTTSMLGYLSLPDDFSTSAGLKSCWSKDTSNNVIVKNLMILQLEEVQ